MTASPLALLGHPVVALAIVGLLMLIETVLSARHERALRRRGAVEPPDDVYGWMQVVYPLGFVACAAEHWWRATPWGPLATAGLVVFSLGKVVKYAAMATLGERWTFRVLPVPGLPPIDRGLYAWLRHPNYVGVAGEIVGIGLWMQAPVSGVLFTVTFVELLRRRIRIEERALASASR